MVEIWKLIQFFYLKKDKVEPPGLLSPRSELMRRSKVQCLRSNVLSDDNGGFISVLLEGQGAVGEGKKQVLQILQQAWLN